MVQSSNSVALFRVAPPAVLNDERDFGLYSRCLGAGSLLSCRGLVVSFGSSGSEIVVAVVKDQRGSSVWLTLLFLVQLPKHCTIMSLTNVFGDKAKKTNLELRV